MGATRLRGFLAHEIVAPIPRHSNEMESDSVPAMPFQIITSGDSAIRRTVANARTLIQRKWNR
jgi:hypothetical protein